jgi:hypothetical protein
MVSTMPSATAWRANSKLVQWVMCKPLAIGSKQPNSTIWARWRGGKLLWATGTRAFPQHAAEAVLLVTAANPPNGADVALGLDGNVLDALSASNAQEDLRMPHLEPRPRTAPCYRFQDRNITGIRHQTTRFSTAHGQPPLPEMASISRSAAAREFLALFRARDLARIRLGSFLY